VLVIPAPEYSAIVATEPTGAVTVNTPAIPFLLVASSAAAVSTKNAVLVEFNP